MKPKYHVAVSTLISGILHMVFKSWALTIASLFSGILVDLDHVIDYVINHSFHLDIKKFFHSFYGGKYKKLTLIFHGWEWLLVLLWASWASEWNHWIIGFMIGIAQHLIIDRLYNISTFLSYSLLWRWKNKFDTNVILLKNRNSKNNSW
jgi:hypothetical protein